MVTQEQERKRRRLNLSLPLPDPGKLVPWLRGQFRRATWAGSVVGILIAIFAVTAANLVFTAHLVNTTKAQLAAQDRAQHRAEITATRRAIAAAQAVGARAERRAIAREVEVNNKKWCRSLTLIDNAARSAPPPTTQTGRALIGSFRTLHREYHCRGR